MLNLFISTLSVAKLITIIFLNVKLLYVRNNFTNSDVSWQFLSRWTISHVLYEGDIKVNLVMSYPIITNGYHIIAYLDVDRSVVANRGLETQFEQW